MFEITSEIEHSRHNLKYWVHHTNMTLEMVIIARFAPESFHDSYVFDTITKILLSLMNLYANEPERVDIENRAEIGFDPETLFKSLVTILLAVKQDDDIIRHMAENAMFPVTDISEKLIPTIERFFCSPIPLALLRV